MRPITRSLALMSVSLLCLACPGKETTDDAADENGTTADTTTDTGTSDEVGTTADTTTTDTTESTTGFIIPDIGGGIVSCDPFAQDCPDGEKCVAYASSGGTWDANKCVPVTGDGAEGDPCIYDGADFGTDDCDENTVCWNAINMDGTLVGTCYPFCMGSADDPICENGNICRIVNDGVITVCLPPCDPLLQDCGEGLGCYWSGGSQTFQCIIVAGSGIPTGDPCGFNNDCAPGNFCAAADVLNSCDGSACCAAFCDLNDDPTTCTDGYSCVPFFDMGQAPPMYESLGLCILPP